MSSTHVYPFAVQDNALAADLDTVGGKGLSLASMTAAGFPVPAGITVTTAAYRQFVSDNGLQEAIIDGAKPELVGTAVSFDSASQQIQALFAKSEENIFVLPGLGRLMVDALNDRDYPVVSGVNLVFGAAVVGVNLMIDLIYPYLDPRVRYS